MTTGENIHTLRRRKNLTEEQLADELSVSSQVVAKWESDLVTPSSEQLKVLSKVLACSIDVLLDEKKGLESQDDEASIARRFISSNARSLYYERKSKKTLFGMPLVHINIGFGRTARGIIAIGLNSVGIISIGLFSFGLISIGILGLGLISIAVLALGFLSIGSFSFGIISIGAIAIGLLSCGSISVGQFSIGALSVGRFFAFGENATAMVAIGAKEAHGTLYSHATGVQFFYGDYDRAAIIGALNEQVPDAMKWLMNPAFWLVGIN